LFQFDLNLKALQAIFIYHCADFCKNILVSSSSASADWHNASTRLRIIMTIYSILQSPREGVCSLGKKYARQMCLHQHILEIHSSEIRINSQYLSLGKCTLPAFDNREA